jgi:hypothetical protein
MHDWYPNFLDYTFLSNKMFRSENFQIITSIYAKIIIVMEMKQGKEEYWENFIQSSFDKLLLEQVNNCLTK